MSVFVAGKPMVASQNVSFFSQATLFSLFFLFFRLWFDFCMVARKGHYNFLFLLKLLRDNSNLSRDKINSYRATIKKIIAR